MNAQPNPEPWTPGQVWAAIMLALTVDTCESILARRPVRAGNLDGIVLRRGLRRWRLPQPESFLVVTPTILDAIDEAGPIPCEA